MIMLPGSFPALLYDVNLAALKITPTTYNPIPLDPWEWTK
jgi:hypothetical protein